MWQYFTPSTFITTVAVNSMVLHFFFLQVHNLRYLGVLCRVKPGTLATSGFSSRQVHWYFYTVHRQSQYLLTCWTCLYIYPFLILTRQIQQRGQWPYALNSDAVDAPPASFLELKFWCAVAVRWRSMKVEKSPHREAAGVLVQSWVSYSLSPLTLQCSTPTQASPHLLLPRPQQGKLQPPWGLRLLPREPPQAPAALHGPVVPQPLRLSSRRLLEPGDELLPGDVLRQPGRRRPRSCRRRRCRGWKLRRGPRFLIAAVDSFLRKMRDANNSAFWDRFVDVALF